MSGHVSVLLEESLQALEIKPNGWYLDATFGRGGHSRAILDQLGDFGRLYALDRDHQAADAAKMIKDPRFFFERAPFSKMATAFADFSAGVLDGVFFDFGVSSPQLDDPMRGFSFQKEGPLDMRMDQSQVLSAKEWLLQCDIHTLQRVIRDFGGEPHGVALRIARAIVEARDNLQTTLDLAEVVASAVPKARYKPHHHPATKTFQAVRMAVNEELREIELALQAAVFLLKKGGVLVAISFHDGEDALFKRFVRAHEGEDLPAEIPYSYGKVGQVLRLISKVVRPSALEVARNVRARSAKLRKAVKL